MKTRENSKKIALMLRVMNDRIKNQILHEYIFDKFECIADGTLELKDVTENSITAINKEGDVFEISFEPNIKSFSKILTSYTSQNNRHKETNEITYEGNETSIKEKETTIYVQSDNMINTIHKSINTYRYQDNQLIYSYNMKSSTGTNVNLKIDGTTIEEMYIFPDKSAVKFTSATGEDNYFGPIGSRFLKTDYYEEPTFDGQKESKGLYIYKFDEISENEYGEYIRNWENQINGFQKQKLG